MVTKQHDGPKIDKDVLEGEMKVVMPKSVALSQVECKSMKVKIEDADRKEYCGVYFDVKKAGQADTVMKMDPP